MIQFLKRLFRRQPEPGSLLVVIAAPLAALDFDESAAENASFPVKVPAGWTAGLTTFVPVWAAPSAPDIEVRWRA
jgi:hypothetical protein